MKSHPPYSYLCWLALAYSALHTIFLKELLCHRSAILEMSDDSAYARASLLFFSLIADAATHLFHNFYSLWLVPCLHSVCVITMYGLELSDRRYGILVSICCGTAISITRSLQYTVLQTTESNDSKVALRNSLQYHIALIRLIGVFMSLWGVTYIWPILTCALICFNGFINFFHTNKIAGTSFCWDTLIVVSAYCYQILLGNNTMLYVIILVCAMLGLQVYSRKNIPSTNEIALLNSENTSIKSQYNLCFAASTLCIFHECVDRICGCALIILVKKYNLCYSDQYYKNKIEFLLMFKVYIKPLILYFIRYFKIHDDLHNSKKVHIFNSIFRLLYLSLICTMGRINTYILIPYFFMDALQDTAEQLHTTRSTLHLNTQNYTLLSLIMNLSIMPAAMCGVFFQNMLEHAPHFSDLAPIMISIVLKVCLASCIVWHIGGSTRPHVTKNIEAQ